MSIDLDKLLTHIVEDYENFIQSIKLDNYNIEDIIKDYPARKARYSVALERFKVELAKKKLEQKILFYELYKKFRKESIEKGVKITEEYLKALIYTSDQYKVLSEEILELENKTNILIACKEALEDQGRMLYLLYFPKTDKFF